MQSCIPSSLSIESQGKKYAIVADLTDLGMNNIVHLMNDAAR